MTATTTPRTTSNGQPRKTLASQLDRLDGILDGLDAALSGAVQDAVEQAVKQAVQAVLTEVLNQPQQLQQAAQPAPLPGGPHDKPSLLNRLWQTTTENVRRTVQTVQRLGLGVGMALVAAGAAVVGVVYAARKQIASVASTVYRHGKRLIQGAVSSLTNFLPTFAFGG